MKRKKGEGMIREREPGKWEARITLNGKPKSFYGSTEREVRKKMKEYKEKFDGGQRNFNRIQYSDFLDIWLERKEKDLKPQSYHRLVSTINTHIKPIVGFYFLDKIDAELIQSEIIDPKSKTLAHSSIKKIYMALNSSFTYAKERKDIVHNPCALVIMPKQTSKVFAKRNKRKNLEIFTDDEIKRFVIASAATYKNGAPIYKNGQMFVLMLNTGIRMGEAGALSWDDYNEDDQTITINSTIIQNKDESGKSVIEEQDSVKSRDSERILKLNTNATQALPKIRKSGYIYCTRDGKPIRPRHIQDLLDSILARAGIPHKSTHVFRHTFASKLFEKGIDVKVVSELLGHSSVAFTYNTYITLIKKQKARAMEAIEDMY